MSTRLCLELICILTDIVTCFLRPLEKYSFMYICSKLLNYFRNFSVASNSTTLSWVFDSHCFCPQALMINVGKIQRSHPICTTGAGGVLFGLVLRVAFPFKPTDPAVKLRFSKSLFCIWLLPHSPHHLASLQTTGTVKIWKRTKVCVSFFSIWWAWGIQGSWHLLVWWNL